MALQLDWDATRKPGIASASVELRAPLLAPDHPLLMRSRLMLSRVEFQLKNLPACEKLLQSEVAIREASPRVSDTELGVALNFLGEQYYLSGRTLQAEPVYERAIAVRRLTHSRGHRLIGEMATAWRSSSRRAGPIANRTFCFARPWPVWKDLWPRTSGSVAGSQRSGGESVCPEQSFEPARRLLERALHIQERSLRANDARLSRTRSNLAAVYVARGRYAEAVRLYERTLNCGSRSRCPIVRPGDLTQQPGRGHCVRWGAIRTPSSVCWNHSRSANNSWGPNTRRWLEILNNLGYLYLHQHRFAEAINLLQRALRIRENCLSATHPQVATTLGTLAEVEFSAGQYEAARAHFSRAIEISSAVYGERHAQLLGLQIASARNEFRLGHLGRAELMLTRSQALVDELLGPDHRNCRPLYARTGRTGSA